MHTHARGLNLSGKNGRCRQRTRGLAELMSNRHTIPEKVWTETKEPAGASAADVSDVSCRKFKADAKFSDAPTERAAQDDVRSMQRLDLLTAQ